MRSSRNLDLICSHNIFEHKFGSALISSGFKLLNRSNRDLTTLWSITVCLTTIDTIFLDVWGLDVISLDRLESSSLVTSCLDKVWLELISAGSIRLNRFSTNSTKEQPSAISKGEGWSRSELINAEWINLDVIILESISPDSNSLAWFICS